jgi:DNA-binding CsgD family transcriptional regulator
MTMGLTDPTLFVLPQIGRLMDSFAIEEVQATLRELTWSMGYEHFLFGQQQDGAGVPEPRQVVVSGYPEAWRKRYVSRNYIAVDPTVAHCLVSSMPLPWTPDLVTEESTPMWEDAARHGLRHGLSLAVHERGGSVSMISLARERPVSDAEMRLSIGMARAVLATLHFAAMNMPLPEAQRVRRLLTPRELDVLGLTTHGLSSAEVGEQLHISARTVHYHMQGLIKKLGCRNRAEAIGKAGSLRLFAGSEGHRGRE